MSKKLLFILAMISSMNVFAQNNVVSPNKGVVVPMLGRMCPIGYSFHGSAHCIGTNVASNITPIRGKNQCPPGFSPYPDSGYCNTMNW